MLGPSTDAYRPSSTDDPLTPANRYLRLPAAFSAPDGRFQRPEPYGAALWDGVFDSAYTQPGDYLVQGSWTWFIAAQQPLLPALCVKANRVVSFARPPAQSAAGVMLMAVWCPPMPCRSFRTGQRACWEPAAAGPTTPACRATHRCRSGPFCYRRGLVSCCDPADLMTDDLGRNAVVAAAELTDLGWRLAVKQATT